jgi:hypothetical protein
MKLTTEKMQDIIDNAPDEAKHYFIASSGKAWYGGLGDLLLDDLRKELEQSKSQPCIKDADTLIKALASEGAKAAAHKDFTEHEKSLGVENNYTLEDITPVGDIEQMAVMATLRKMRGQYFESLYDDNWSLVDGTHIDLALFHRKSETGAQKAAKLKADWVDKIVKSTDEELAGIMISNNVQLTK